MKPFPLYRKWEAIALAGSFRPSMHDRANIANVQTCPRGLDCAEFSFDESCPQDGFARQGARQVPATSVIQCSKCSKQWNLGRWCGTLSYYTSSTLSFVLLGNTWTRFCSTSTSKVHVWSKGCKAINGPNSAPLRNHGSGQYCRYAKGSKRHMKTKVFRIFAAPDCGHKAV